MKERIATISPDTIVNALPIFYLPETKDQFDFSQYDYIIDAIDNVTAKIDLIVTAKSLGVPIISYVLYLFYSFHLISVHGLYCTYSIYLATV